MSVPRRSAFRRACARGTSTLLVLFLGWRALAALQHLPALANASGLEPAFSWPLEQRIRLQLTGAAENFASGDEAWKLLQLLESRTGARAVVLVRFQREKTVLRYVLALQNAAFPRSVLRADSAAELQSLRSLARQQGRDEVYALCLAGRAETAWEAGARRVGATPKYELWRLNSGP